MHGVFGCSNGGYSSYLAGTGQSDEHFASLIDSFPCSPRAPLLDCQTPLCESPPSCYLILSLWPDLPRLAKPDLLCGLLKLLDFHSFIITCATFYALHQRERERGGDGRIYKSILLIFNRIQLLSSRQRVYQNSGRQ